MLPLSLILVQYPPILSFLSSETCGTAVSWSWFLPVVSWEAVSVQSRDVSSYPRPLVWLDGCVARLPEIKETWRVTTDILGKVHYDNLMETATIEWIPLLLSFLAKITLSKKVNCLTFWCLFSICDRCKKKVSFSCVLANWCLSCSCLCSISHNSASCPANKITSPLHIHGQKWPQCGLITRTNDKDPHYGQEAYFSFFTRVVNTYVAFVTYECLLLLEKQNAWVSHEKRSATSASFINESWNKICLNTWSLVFFLQHTDARRGGFNPGEILHYAGLNGSQKPGGCLGW